MADKKKFQQKIIIYLQLKQQSFATFQIKKAHPEYNLTQSESNAFENFTYKI